jgi:putative sigma-54 modulation protein
MNVTITARHFELTDEEKGFIEERVKGLSRYYSRIIEAHVTVKGERHRIRAEIKVNINNNVFFSETESTDIRQSVEKVVQKLERQIKKHKGRFRKRTMDKEELAILNREASVPDMDEEEFVFESPHTRDVEEMTLSEAVQRVRSGNASILFKDRASGRVKAVHRRGDGKIDVMEMGPEGSD